MTIRDIIIAPDPRLKAVSKTVDRVDDDLRALMDDMVETMHDAPGIGLAAIQIGVAKRVIVMDLAKEGEEPDVRCFVNPEIIEESEDFHLYEEGCLRCRNIMKRWSAPPRSRFVFSTMKVKFASWSAPR